MTNNIPPQRMTLVQLVQEKIKRLKEANQKKIDNLSEAEKLIRSNLKRGLGDPEFENKKLGAVIMGALSIATTEGEEEAKLRKLLKTLHEAEAKKDDTKPTTGNETKNKDAF